MPIFTVTQLRIKATTIVKCRPANDRRPSVTNEVLGQCLFEDKPAGLLATKKASDSHRSTTFINAIEVAIDDGGCRNSGCCCDQPFNIASAEPVIGVEKQEP